MFRRQFQEWELEGVDVLLSLLVEVGPFQEGINSMQWIPHQGGRFLVSSYHKTLQGQGGCFP